MDIWGWNLFKAGDFGVDGVVFDGKEDRVGLFTDHFLKTNKYAIRYNNL